MTKHTKLTLIMLSALALGLIVLVALNILNIRAQNEETSKLLLLADEASGEGASLQSGRSLQNSAQEEIELFETFVLTEDKLVSLIETIESTGRKLGLQTETVSVEKELDASGVYSKVSLLLETEGSWVGSTQYLKALESLPNRVLVDEVHFLKERGVWVSRFGISFYEFK